MHGRVQNYKIRDVNCASSPSLVLRSRCTCARRRVNAAKPRERERVRERAVGKPELTDNYEFTYKKLYAYKIATSGVFAFTAQIAKVLTIVALFSRLSHAQESSVSRTPAYPHTRQECIYSQPPVRSVGRSIATIRRLYQRE